jgi:5'-nucleotidase
MKNLMLTAMVISIGFLTVGCANSKKPPVATNESVTDLNAAPAAPRDGGYAGPINAAPAPAPVYAEPAPAVTETPTTAAPAAGGTAATAGGSSYTVKKGDTLFSIARSAYGNGNQWQRIAQANPGLSPTTLKAGKTIVIP